MQCVIFIWIYLTLGYHHRIDQWQMHMLFRVIYVHLFASRRDGTPARFTVADTNEKWCRNRQKSSTAGNRCNCAFNLNFSFCPRFDDEIPANFFRSTPWLISQSVLVPTTKTNTLRPSFGMASNRCCLWHTHSNCKSIFEPSQHFRRCDAHHQAWMFAKVKNPLWKSTTKEYRLQSMSFQPNRRIGVQQQNLIFLM